MSRLVIATNMTRGVTLATHARVADNILTRVVGLLRDKGLAEGDGLWIVPCNSIHSIAMKFVFDAVFLDREMKVVHLMHEMKPWRISPIKGTAHGVLELPPGTITRSGTQVGDQFELRPLSCSGGL
jgi:uncharacterized membrane protein (UPF0127 family)